MSKKSKKSFALPSARVVRGATFALSLEEVDTICAQLLNAKAIARVCMAAQNDPDATHEGGVRQALYAVETMIEQAMKIVEKAPKLGAAGGAA